MPASEETGSGPVIRDHRRIDPVTGQVRGKHAASKPVGTSGAGRPAGPATGQAGQPGPADPADHGAEVSGEPQGNDEDNIVTQKGPEEVIDLEGILKEANEAERHQTDAEVR